MSSGMLYRLVLVIVRLTSKTKTSYVLDKKMYLKNKHGTYVHKINGNIYFISSKHR